MIPSFLRRVDLPERGEAWSRYLGETRRNTAALVDELFGDEQATSTDAVTLTDFDPDGEDKLLAAICFAHTEVSEAQIARRLHSFGTDERVALLRSYIGNRGDRRHKPGRAFERTGYRFEVLSDYGAFRDLQRHRMLTIEWQRLTPAHGYVVPQLVSTPVSATCTRTR